MTTSTRPSLANLTLILLVLTAAAYDVHTHRIPNWLVGMGLVSAFIAQGMAIDVDAGCLVWFDGAAVSVGLCFGFSVFDGMGADDVKLMGAIDTFMRPFGVFHVALVSFLAGDVLALIAVLPCRGARRSTTRVSVLSLLIPFGSKIVCIEGQGPKYDGTIQLPYVVVFAADTLLVKQGAMQSGKGTLARIQASQEQLMVIGQA